MKLFKKIIFLSIMIMMALVAEVSAANIRAGLYFGSSAPYSFVTESANGFNIGFARDKNFNKLVQIGEKSIYVEQGGGVYLISDMTYDSLPTAMNTSLVIRNMGMHAHSGYIDGKFHVLIGLFNSVEEASSYVDSVKQLTAVDFKPVVLDTKTVFALAGNYGFVFRNESDVLCFSAPNEGFVKVSGKGEYRGAIMADRRYSNGVSAINLVEMDDYLASVVGSEMYPSWHSEALKAQAVIARSYALRCTGYLAYGIDVTDDVRTQAYKGTEKETPSTYKAAHDTSGEVVMYNGKIAETFFYSMSGGITADVYSAWGGGAGLDYLKSKQDIYEDVSNIKSDIWKVPYTSAEIEAKLSESGINIGNVVSLTIAERGNDMRVRKLVIQGTAGQHILTFDKCRSFFNLRSQYFYISGNEANGDKVYALSATSQGEVALSGSSVISQNGVAKINGDVSVLGASSSKSISSRASNTVVSNEFIFDGRGNGHGVGMSQYGAQGMAQAGFNYADIIKFYYSGVEVVKYQ